MNEKNIKYVKQLLSKLVYQVFIFLLPVTVYSQNLLNGPNDIVFDSLNNRYLVANWAGNSIVAIDSLGNQSYFRSNITHAHGMEIKDSILFVVSYRNLLLIDLYSSSTINSIFVPGSEYLGHIALDSSHYVYVTDWSAKKLFRININDQTSATLHTLDPIPGGLSYEVNNNRLILLIFVDNAPILAYNLASGNIDTVRNTNINEPDAICRDLNGNYYITSFADNIVYRFDSNFAFNPEIISTGHSEPSGIGYNMSDNIIGVTNYNINRVDLINLSPNNLDFQLNNTPIDFVLFQNYPNPFNPTTKINFQIPELSFVTLKIYDVLGNEIAALVNEEKVGGSYEVEFNATGLPSGIYFYQLTVSENITIKKMVLLK
ncbi:MAG: T9SS type A sorting domain-containing protein [Ignavibacteriaceae bacterium]|nr:T9SS type A sorting domain-containing protein [Ignavibacteriaceae bacterium]